VSDPSHEHLAQRLDRLERENRRLKRLGALALVSLAALTVMGQTAPVPVANTLEAERFVLRDASGLVRATLGLRSDGTAALALADDTQQERAVVGVTAQGLPAVELSERSGRQRASFAVRADGSASLSLLDQGDRPRLELRAQGDGRPSLTLLDQSGRPPLAPGPDRGGRHRPHALRSKRADDAARSGWSRRARPRFGSTTGGQRPGDARGEPRRTAHPHALGRGRQGAVMAARELGLPPPLPEPARSRRQATGRGAPAAGRRAPDGSRRRQRASDLEGALARLMHGNNLLVLLAVGSTCSRASSCGSFC
jgi:hypothetical protein